MAIGGTIVFALVAASQGSGTLHPLDERLMLGFRHAGDLARPIGPGWLQSGMRDVTALGSRAILGPAVAAIAGYLLVTGYWRRGLRLALYVTAGSLAGEIAKLVFARPRPQLVPHEVVAFSSSFPSGHALQSSIVFLTLAAALAADQRSSTAAAYIVIVAVLATLAVGVSRVYLGVHWPSDVLAGWALGSAWAAACWLAETRWRLREV